MYNTFPSCFETSSIADYMLSRVVTITSCSSLYEKLPVARGFFRFTKHLQIYSLKAKSPFITCSSIISSLENKKIVLIALPNFNNTQVFWPVYKMF